MLSKENLILIENLQQQGLLEKGIDLNNINILELEGKLSALAVETILKNIPLDTNLNDNGCSIFTEKDLEEWVY